MGKFFIAAAAAATVVLSGGAASGAVVVLGKSLAAGCSKSAIAGNTDRRSIDLCSRALDEEALNGRILAGTFVNRGVMRMRRGEIAQARTDFEAAVATDPKLGEAFVNRGSVHIYEGRFQEGLADTERGLALGLSEPERAYFNRAMAREWMDDEKGAYLDYRKAAELNPKWALPREQLARFTVVSNRR